MVDAVFLWVVGRRVVSRVGWLQWLTAAAKAVEVGLACRVSEWDGKMGSYRAIGSDAAGVLIGRDCVR